MRLDVLAVRLRIFALHLLECCFETFADVRFGLKLGTMAIVLDVFCLLAVTILMPGMADHLEPPVIFVFLEHPAEVFGLVPESVKGPRAKLQWNSQVDDPGH